jgi:hypothetical protein
VDGRVTLQGRNRETKYVHVLNASTTPYADDPFGQVTAGVIRLACSSMAAGHLVSWKKSNEEGFNILLHANKEEKELPIRIDCSDDGQQEDSGEVYLLSIITGKTGAAAGLEGKDRLYELLITGTVLRLTDFAEGEFSRIEPFHFYKTKAMWTGIAEIAEIADESYEPFLKVMEEQGITTAEAACAEIISSPEHPDKRCVITLI